jgi:inorganic pyrophosphatase
MTMEEETFVPLNDMGKGLARKSSFGSDKDVSLDHQGEHDTTDYRLHAVHAEDGKKRVSLWHDISLVHIDHTTKKSTNCFNFVCEIPKFTR